MSCYIVDNKTIDIILTHLYNIYRRENSIHKFTTLGYTLYDDDNEMGQNMLEMNYKAINQRYNLKEINLMEYKYTSSHRNIYQVLKSLRCYLHQCSEGNITKDPLYEAFQEMEYNIMFKLISEKEEYKNATWG